MPWDEAQAYLQDEQQFRHVYEMSRVMEGSVLHRAVGIVLGVLTSDVWFGVTSRERAMLRIDGIADAAVELQMTPEALFGGTDVLR